MSFAAYMEGRNRSVFKSQVGKRRALWRRLAKLLRGKIKLSEALATMRSLTPNGSPTASALDDWLRQIRNGRTFAVAVRPWVSDEEYMLLAAGQQTGDLAGAINSVLLLAQAKTDIRGAVIKGLSYPVFLFVMAIAVTYGFGFFIVPLFAKIVRGGGWTGQAAMMIHISDFLKAWFPILLSFLMGSIALFVWLLPRWNSPWRVVLDRYPPFKLYRITQGTAWLISLAALVEAKVPLLMAIEQLRERASPWLLERLNAVVTGLKAGHDLGASLRIAGHEFPDREIIADLKIYGAQVGFDEALRSIGNEWIGESVVRIRAQMAVVFGISIVLVGVVLAFFVTGMISMQIQLPELLKRVSR